MKTLAPFWIEIEVVFHCFISGPAAQPDQMEKLLLLFAKPIPSHQLFSCSCNTVTNHRKERIALCCCSCCCCCCKLLLLLLLLFLLLPFLRLLLLLLFLLLLLLLSLLSKRLRFFLFWFHPIKTAQQTIKQRLSSFFCFPLRLQYEQDVFVDKITSTLEKFDADLRTLRHEKRNLEVALKCADLRWGFGKHAQLCMCCMHCSATMP